MGRIIKQEIMHRGFAEKIFQDNVYVCENPAETHTLKLKILENYYTITCKHRGFAERFFSRQGYCLRKPR